MGKAIRPKVLVLASGEKDGGGSGFMELVEFSRTDPPILFAEIVGVVSNHESGGVFKKAEKLDVPFYYFPKPYTAEMYQYFVEITKADYVMCSGWLPFVRGLDVKTTINIHPGPLPEFGGKGFHGKHVHEAVMEVYRRREVYQSAVTMHFMDEVDYDHGPKIFEFPVAIRENDDSESLGSRVNEKERAWQSYILNLVVNGYIWLEVDGENRLLYAEKGLRDMIPGFTGKYK